MLDMPELRTKESFPKPPPPLFNPPSPRTHRALRRLQSAHALGQSSQPSLISQQHKHVLLRNPSPVRGAAAAQHTRTRSNSDATNMTAKAPAARRPVMKQVAADALPLDRLIREGPPDGNLTEALDSVRLKILDQGIKSDTDGMVSRFCSKSSPKAGNY